MADEVRSVKDLWGTLTSYQKWLQTEGLEVIKGFSVDDLRTVLLKPWERKGGKGVYINLDGTKDTDDAYVCEIPPGGALKPQKHLYEEMIFILSGKGATEVWNEGGRKQRIEWQEGSLFAIPLNAWHQHFNRQPDQPARYWALTGAPTVIDLFHNTDFVFNCDYVFTDRYNGEEDYFSGGGKFYPEIRQWDVNFIPNVPNLQLLEWKERGAGGTNMSFEQANGVMASHTSEFPVGTYKKGHRHGPGAQIVILNGKGYSLLWKEEGDPKRRVDWHPGSTFCPPDRWLHQHFNTSREPARYMALRTVGSSNKFLTGKQFRAVGERSLESYKLGGDQIEYEDEDPEVQKLFEAELAKEGIEVRMPPVGKSA